MNGALWIGPVAKAGSRRLALSLVAVSALLFGAAAGAGAQPFPGAQSSPGAQPTPVEAQSEPYLHVGATVHKVLVQAVESDGTLWLDLEGRPVRVRLEDLEIAGADTASGREARKLLGRFVGRWIRFAFQGAVAHELREVGSRERGGAGRTEAPGLRAASHDGGRAQILPAYAPIVDRLLETGLARYCPGPGRISSGLARLEQEARDRRVGIWRVPDDAPTCGAGLP